MKLEMVVSTVHNCIFVMLHTYYRLQIATKQSFKRQYRRIKGQIVKPAGGRTNILNVKSLLKALSRL